MHKIQIYAKLFKLFLELHKLYTISLVHLSKVCKLSTKVEVCVKIMRLLKAESTESMSPGAIGNSLVTRDNRSILFPGTNKNKTKSSYYKMQYILSVYRASFNDTKKINGRQDHPNLKRTDLVLYLGSWYYFYSPAHPRTLYRSS